MARARLGVLPVLLALGALAAGSCSADPPVRARAPLAPPVAASGAGREPPRAPSPPAPGPARDGGPAPAAVEDAGGPAFGAAPSRTPGQIVCGDARCDLGAEVCCEHEERGVARCLPRPPPDGYACDGVSGAPTERRCDEKADCPGAQACCMTWACSGECPPVAVCSDAPCLHGAVEQCLPGGECSAGFRCEAARGGRPGTCVLTNPGVACGETRCSGARPLCCWNAKTRSGECARECSEEPDEDRWSLGCTTPDDCAGHPCANLVPSPVPFSSCTSAYDVPDRSSVVFCRTIADCPVMNLLGKPRACAHDRRFPSGTRTCRFSEG